MSESTLNVPQLLVILVITGLLVRWFFSKQSTTAGNGTRPASRQNVRRVNPAHVEQISQMFPQTDRRQIMWDLHRNGGNMHATTERILSGRPLEVPPPTFQPPTPPRSNTPSNTRTAPAAAQRPQHPDLITRYNLSSKVAAEEAEGEEPEQTKARWSQSKTERQTLLQKRRDEMILAARRKMLEKDKAKEKAPRAGASA